MELRHLRYFVAVGEDEHYGRAAQRLRVAQPALSSQIQDLEREIGFQLFDRLPRGVRLSAGGKVFLRTAVGFSRKWTRRRSAPGVRRAD
jgi:DNA-binding transcriptional LysR family regulator